MSVQEQKTALSAVELMRAANSIPAVFANIAAVGKSEDGKVVKITFYELASMKGGSDTRIRASVVMLQDDAQKLGMMLAGLRIGSKSNDLGV